jgi:hypothetical protein
MNQSSACLALPNSRNFEKIDEMAFWTRRSGSFSTRPSPFTYPTGTATDRNRQLAACRLFLASVVGPDAQQVQLVFAQGALYSQQ